MTHQGVCGVVVLFNIHETPTRAVVSARWLLVYCLQYRRSLADLRSVAGKGVNTDTPGLGYRIRYKLSFFMERTASQNSGRVTRESGLPAASI